MKKSKKRQLLLLSILAFIVLLAIANYYIVNKIIHSTTSSEITTTPPPETRPEIISSNTPLDWKTYTNTTYDYTIKYPSNWYVDTEFSNTPFTPRGAALYPYIGGDTFISNYSTAYLQNYQKVNGPLSQPKDYFGVSLGFTKVDPNMTIEEYLDLPENNPPSGMVGSMTEQSVVLNGIPGEKKTELNITGLGDNTKPNSTGVILKRSVEIIEIGYRFDNSVKALIPIGDEIVDSFTSIASTHP